MRFNRRSKWRREREEETSLFDRSQVSDSSREEWDGEYHHGRHPRDLIPVPGWYQVADYKEYGTVPSRQRKRKKDSKEKRISRSKLDRIRKLYDIPQVRYEKLSRRKGELFNMLSTKYEDLNKVAELQISKLQAEIEERTRLISSIGRAFKTDPILVKTSAVPLPAKLVLPTDDDWETCSEEANRIMQKALELYYRIKRQEKY